MWLALGKVYRCNKKETSKEKEKLLVTSNFSCSIDIFTNLCFVLLIISAKNLSPLCYEITRFQHIFKDENIDGINQWDEISQGGVSKRTELVYNLDDVVPATQGHAAIR